MTVNWQFEGIPAYRFASVLFSRFLDGVSYDVKIDELKIAPNGELKILAYDLIKLEHGRRSWFRRDNFRDETLWYTGRLEVYLDLSIGDVKIHRMVWLSYEHGRLMSAQDASLFLIDRLTASLEGRE